MYWNNPNDSLIFCIQNVVGDMDHTIYISRNKYPSADNYDWKKQIQAEDLNTDNNITIIVNDILYTESTLMLIHSFLQEWLVGQISLVILDQNSLVLLLMV
jgi:hypothetical protein